MALSIIITFIIALVASFSVPGWEFGGHFFPYTFLIALVLAWGTDTNILVVGIFFATGFELFLGLHLGTISIAFLSVVILHLLLQHPVDLKPLVREGWSFLRFGLNLAVGTLLWIVAVAVSWSMLELVYSKDYPASAVFMIIKDIPLFLGAVSEIALFLVLMTLIRWGKKPHGYFS